MGEYDGKYLGWQRGVAWRAEARRGEEERGAAGPPYPNYLFFPINTDLVARFTSENVSRLARPAAPKLLKS